MDYIATADSLHRIRRGVIISLICTFVAVAGVRIYVLWDNRAEMLERGRERVQNLASLVADQFTYTIEMIDGSLLRISQLASQLKESGNDIELTTILERSYGTIRGINALTILNSVGEITHSTAPQIIGQSRADRPLYKTLLLHHQTDLVADAAYESKVSGQLLLPLGRRIRTAGGEFAGIVVATLELERLREFYRSFHVGKRGVIWIVHPDGHVLFRQPHGDRGEQKLGEGHPLLVLPAVFTPNAVYAGRLDRSGERYLTGIRQIQVPSVRIAVSLSEDEILESWWRELQISVLILLGTALAIGVAGLHVYRQIGARLAEAGEYAIKARQFQDILDHAPASVTVKGTDGRIRLANLDFLTRIGRTQQDTIGRKLDDLLPTRYVEKLKLLDDEVIRSKSVIQREIQWDAPRTHMTTKFPLLDSRGEVDAVGSIALDISDVKALQTINFRIFEKSVDIILVCDSQGNLLRVSPSVTAILGYRPDELEGNNAVNFIHPDDLEQTRYEMRAARREGGSRNFHSRYFHKDGRAIVLVWTGMWVEEEQQHLYIGHDLTERTKLEAELRQSQKMEAIGQLTGGLAHDYNNLLTVILGNAELLAEELRGNEKLYPLAQAALDAANRSAVLTQRLLAFGRRQALDSKPVDLNEIVRDMSDLIRLTIGENISVELSLDETPFIVSIDRNQLETALLNLVVNARDAMASAGVLRIETARASYDEETVSMVPQMGAGQYVELTVSDTGCGMDAETLLRVFEPFFTTKEIGKGTGLGLSMVYGFVKQSGGHVSIQSEPGRGTTVKLSFPSSDREIAFAEPVEDGSSPTLQSTGESILLVEDDPLVRDNTERQLIAMGYRVVVAGSGREALRKFKAGFRPDLLLTDVILGGEMNGKELAERLLKIEPRLAVLYMSGYTSGILSNSSDRQAFQAAHFIGKPFRRAQLAEAIMNALHSKLADA